MTMHRAKGLEFDHVVLYGLGRKPGGGGASVLSWFDMPGPHGDEHKVISPIGPRKDVDRDPIHRYIAATAAEKEAHEQGRLLYVACTRAQKSLHIVGNVTVSKDGEDFGRARSDSLLHLLWPTLEPAYADAFVDWSGPPGGAGETTFVEPVRRVFDAAWSLPEVLPLAGPEVAADPAGDDDEVEFYWVGTEARIAGTLAHRWLQLMADGSVPQEAEQALRDVTSRWLQEMGIAGDSATRVTDRVQQALQGTLADSRGRWLLEGEGHAELALTGVYDGEIESVVLDRVRIDESGRHWIVDYKTSTHEGGNLQGFLDVETARYAPQLEKYASIYESYAGEKPLCALYFPLLQAFVELQ